MKTEGLSEEAQIVGALADNLNEKDMEFLLALIRPGWTNLGDFLLKRKKQGLWVPSDFESLIRA